MSISEQDKKLLWGRAGNQCSMPGGLRLLATEAGTLGEMAHIRGRALGGPRSVEGGSSDAYER